MNYFYLMVFICLYSSYIAAQEHSTLNSACDFYVPTNSKTAVTRDADNSCKACQAIRLAEYNKLAEKAQAESKRRTEMALREREKYRESLEVEKRDKELRNRKALAELAKTSEQISALRDIQLEAQQRKSQIEERINHEIETKSRAYKNYLNELQEAAGLNIPNENDPFWLETLSPANYVAFQSTQFYQWGFKDKAGNVKIEPKYQKALNFSNGVSCVGFSNNNPNFYEERIIDANEKILAVLDPNTIKKEVKQATGLTVMHQLFPDTLSNNILIVRFSIEGKWNERTVGAIDIKGKLIVPPLFFSINGFKNGVAQAEKLLDSETYSFKTFPYTFTAQFNLIEEGLIDTQGNWIEPPQKKLQYNYTSEKGVFLEIISQEMAALSIEERKAVDEKVRLNEMQVHAESMNKLEAEVNRRITSARSKGYLIEKRK